MIDWKHIEKDGVSSLVRNRLYLVSNGPTIELAQIDGDVWLLYIWQTVEDGKQYLLARKEPLSAYPYFSEISFPINPLEDKP